MSTALKELTIHSEKIKKETSCNISDLLHSLIVQFVSIKTSDSVKR